MSDFRFKSVKGKDIEVNFSDLSRIRVEVFREWPYLYQGSLEYEKSYLKNYFDNERSLCIFCYVDGKVVGVSTLMPLEGEHDELKNPVAQAGFDIKKIFYYSESCLLPAFRGQGVYKEFFKLREEHVRSFGSEYEKVCFCSVQRPDKHPLKPKNYRPLDSIWKKYGFYQVEGLQMSFSWTDIEQEKESSKKLNVWMKDLR